MQIKRVNETWCRFQVKQAEAMLGTEELCLPSRSVTGTRKQRADMPEGGKNEKENPIFIRIQSDTSVLLQSLVSTQTSRYHMCALSMRRGSARMGRDRETGEREKLKGRRGGGMMAPLGKFWPRKKVQRKKKKYDFKKNIFSKGKKC